MARARNLKPSFFNDAELLECEMWIRLLFAGLWTIADREGRLLDRPKQIGVDIFPRDVLDIECGLRSLAEHGLIVRYEVDGQRIIWIKNFSRHQNPHKDERASTLPALPSKEEHGANPVLAPCEPGANRAESLLLSPDPGIPIPDSGLLDDPRERAEVDTPYRFLEILCETTSRDITKLTTREKNYSLAVAKRLINDAVTCAEVRGFVEYLQAEHWRTGPITMTTVDEGIGTWRASGSPPQPRTRGRPGGTRAVSDEYAELTKRLQQEQRDERSGNGTGSYDAHFSVSALPAVGSGHGEDP